MAKVVKAKKAKPVKVKGISKKKIAIWIFSGVAIIVILAAIAMFVAMKISSNDDDNNDIPETFIVENGKGEEITTEYYQIDDSKIFIKIPTDFHTLTSAEINKKYSGEVPNTVFANANDDVNVAISVSNSEVKNDQIKEYLDVMRELLESSNEVTSTDYYEVNKHNVASIKVETVGDNGNFYNHMMFFSYDDRLVIIAFNCSLKLRSDWEKVGDFILRSLKFEK